jgi:hypothetical protein
MKHLKKFENSFFSKDIRELSKHQLLSHFKDAVADYNYNPTSTPYNDSGFSYDELESEILKRMGEDGDDGDDGSWGNEDY